MAAQKPPPGRIGETVDSDGNTYLHALIREGANIELVREAVLSLGADVNALNHRDQPPLALAIIDGRTELAACLLELGAAVYLPVENGRFFNAAFTASCQWKQDMLHLILEKGGAFHVNSPGIPFGHTPEGYPCLHAALKNWHWESIPALVAAGALIEMPAGPEHKTPLMLAVHNYTHEGLKRLLALGANPDARHLETGYTALHHAVEQRNRVAAEILLKAGADPNLLAVDGLSPLMLAADNGSAAIAELLIAHGADINVRETGAGQETALIKSARRANTDVLRVLLKAGADPLLTDTFNQRASAHTYDFFTRRLLEEAEEKAEQVHFESAYRKHKP